MILVSVRDVTQHFGGERPVLEGVSFQLRPGDRLALIGPNGEGKTTLLRLIVGELDPDAGSIERHPSARFGYLAQQATFDGQRTVWDEAREALGDLVILADQLQRAAQLLAESEPDERPALARRVDQLQHELDQHDAYTLDHRIEKVLMGLGFLPSQFAQPVDQLSRGQQSRLMLAKLLIQQPDVLLLDEPSNHLDLESTSWLEQYLAASAQTFIVVSHDRYFLDKVTNGTLELLRGSIDRYRGNFSSYWQQKSQRLEVQRRTYLRQQAQIAKLEDFVRRHHYGQKHAQAEDRRKKRARIQSVQPPRQIDLPPMTFRARRRAGDLVLRVEHLTKAYGRLLFADVTFDCLRGQRWGILGRNGSGKTTLLRCLLGHEPADAGCVHWGAGTDIGYLDQLLQLFDEQAELVEAVRPAKPMEAQLPLFERRNLLARFGLTGEMAHQRVSQLSGGERNRLALARLAASDANVLVLDEPTNHLDLWARAALEQALQKFEGTVLVVSHDRYFLNQVVDHMLVLDQGTCQIVFGNYDAFARCGAQTTGAGTAAAESHAADSSAQRRHRRTAAPELRRKRRFPYRKVADIEQEIFDLEDQVRRLHEDLARPDVLRNGQRVKSIQQQLTTVQARLDELYEHWQEAAERDS